MLGCGVARGFWRGEGYGRDCRKDGVPFRDGVGRPPGSVNRSQTRARLLPTHRVEASLEYFFHRNLLQLPDTFFSHLFPIIAIFTYIFFSIIITQPITFWNA